METKKSPGALNILQGRGRGFRKGKKVTEDNESWSKLARSRQTLPRGRPEPGQWPRTQILWDKPCARLRLGLKAEDVCDRTGLAPLRSQRCSLPWWFFFCIEAASFVSMAKWKGHWYDHSTVLCEVPVNTGDHWLHRDASAATNQSFTTIRDTVIAEIFVRVKISYSSARELSYAINFRTARAMSHTLVCVHSFRMLLNFVLSAKSTK